mmetsp:Transcript_128063/g.370640  ORF Transcript_128063/g.370640 Transcript_128063/m.370640 type:complete len:231 (+) Transcript_128063:44-736(+)|eukprot:CAMPEP_0176018622 /NCGR_PEP_ID=MMETSP0120_2-20121206/8972_1 /TAXON_ID=160619 /ORGANISM="Kryptoperidinium foliaceum, Strain CCMP 1326" /LENGTH=230 /DNA_ID=CAMNT_0017351677 /DNA_START=38 /DNA_END=730 /DNA_ORIENTATION=+
MAEIPGWVKFCGNMAPLAAIVVFLSPFPTISQIGRDKSVGSLPLLPYSSMFANCFLWSVYGILKQESKIWATNGIGIFFSLFYFLRFVKFAPPKSPTFPGSIRQHVQAIVMVMAATFGLVYLSPLSDPANLLGNIAVLFCVAMFASPLAALRTVLQTKSAKSIPLPFTLATVANCFLWSVFGILEIHDANVYIPNLLGLAFGIAQVSLKMLYGDGHGGAAKLANNLDLIA